MDFNTLLLRLGIDPDCFENRKNEDLKADADPEIGGAYEYDEALSIESRKNIIKYAQDNKLLIAGMHLQYSNSSMHREFYKK